MEGVSSFDDDAAYQANAMPQSEVMQVPASRLWQHVAANAMFFPCLFMFFILCIYLIDLI